MKMEQSVPKRRHIKSRRRVITQKKVYNFLDLFVEWIFYVWHAFSQTQWKVKICQNLNKIDTRPKTVVKAMHSHSAQLQHHSDEVYCVWNVMAHAQKPDFVFQRNGRVHLNRRGHQSSRLLAVEVCVSPVVMLDTACSEVVWRVLATHSIRQFPPHFPSRASPCAVTLQLDFYWRPTCSLNFASQLHVGGSPYGVVNASFSLYSRGALLTIMSQKQGVQSSVVIKLAVGEGRGRGSAAVVTAWREYLPCDATYSCAHDITRCCLHLSCELVVSSSPTQLHASPRAAAAISIHDTTI